MGTIPDSSDIIMVAYIGSPRDLEIARVLGWYRIPLRTAPKIISVDYLAFYQPASFGEGKWSIQWIAPVRGHELTTRATILKDEVDHPKASEEYFKIQLGSLIKLDEPIVSDGWKRITFFFTTGEYLQNASKISQLIVHQDERRMLWRALRERASHESGYHTDDSSALEIDPQVLNQLLGIHEAPAGYGGAEDV